MDARAGFGSYLRSRRERLDPADVGLPPTPRRRTPGLRRAEVAGLAAISVDYYTRLERGRSGPPSASVLRSLGAALRLDPDDHAQLLALAFPRDAGASVSAASAGGATTAGVDTAVRALLGALAATTPALVVGPDLQVLAWNDLAAATLTDFARCPRAGRNLVRHWFDDPAPRWRYADPHDTAADVQLVRCLSERRPDDCRLADLVEHLVSTNAEFARAWALTHAAAPAAGPRTLEHADVGRLDLQLAALTVPGPSGQTVLTYSAAPGSETQRRLSVLASAA